jgi:hypothetical protein
VLKPHAAKRRSAVIATSCEVLNRYRGWSSSFVDTHVAPCGSTDAERNAWNGTYHELDILFAKKVPARKFATTVVDSFDEHEPSSLPRVVLSLTPLVVHLISRLFLPGSEIMQN